MVRRGLEACERLSPLCLYVLGRLAATLQNLYKHVSVHDVAKSIQTCVCTTHTVLFEEIPISNVRCQHSIGNPQK